jgi:peptidoglycan/LPS O-acetylase OafA/YrhL
MQSNPPNDEPTRESPAAILRRARRCRITAVVVLLLGIIGAVVIYWRGPREPDYSNDPSMLGFNRATERQMGVLYGKQGELIEDLNNSLKQPSTQAILVVVAAAIVAVGCFYFARVLEYEAKEAADNLSDQKPASTLKNDA